MRILIDIGHPAHVHYFKNTALSLINNGHTVLFTVRRKEVAVELLKKYNFSYVITGKPYSSVFGKMFGLLSITLRVLNASIKFKPDILVNFTFYSAFSAFLLRKPHVSIEDTFNKESVRLVLPFTNSVITGNYAHPDLGRKEIKIDSYQELMYLHPKYFTPQKSVLSELGVDSDERYVIIRFVSWQASHDYGHKGILDENKIYAVDMFSKFARVFISSEGSLPEDLEKYRININPTSMHSAIYYSSLVFGESSTMSEEAAMLGVPSIYLFNKGTYYTNHLEKDFKLLYNFSESEQDQYRAIDIGVKLLKQNSIKSAWENKRKHMLVNKIDYTGFLIWFIENYPESARIMKENPEYQYKFK